MTEVEVHDTDEHVDKAADRGFCVWFDSLGSILCGHSLKYFDADSIGFFLIGKFKLNRDFFPIIKPNMMA